MTLTTGLRSSLADDWETPPDVFAALDREFRFTLDVAADADNAKCDRWFGVVVNGLAQDWAPAACWMNPPYGREIEYWVAKAAVEASRGATVVGLLPARTDTRWWHSWVQPWAEVRFIKGRLRFSGAVKDAPFPSAIAIWRPA
jgi:phage N-6-adenine-methyltransferase